MFKQLQKQKQKKTTTTTRKVKKNEKKLKIIPFNLLMVVKQLFRFIITSHFFFVKDRYVTILRV